MKLSLHTAFLQHSFPPCHSRCPLAVQHNNEGWRQPGGDSKREWTAEGLCRQGFKKKCYPLFPFFFFTFLVHCLTVLTSSEMTMSTHLVHGSLIFPICLFTMVSKAMSGVKRPVLPGRERTSHRAKKRGGWWRERKKERRREGWVKRRVLIVKNYPLFLRFSPKHKQTQIRQREEENGATCSRKY